MYKDAIPNNKAFTLLELVVVIIIIAILAALGFTQYNKVVESARLTEARVRLGLMRTLVTEYYLENGVLDGIQNSDVGADFTCSSDSFYRYVMGAGQSGYRDLNAYRCTSGGKSPNVAREYVFSLMHYPGGTGQDYYRCQYTDDGSSCFGLPPE